MTQTIEDVEFSSEAHEAFRQFGGYSNYRAIPSVVDGLKPGARRSLWAMREFKYTPDKPTVKAMSAIGDIMKYHPHGDTGCYTTLTGMAHVPDEGVSLKKLVPLIYGQGSWGDLDNDAAASRYTECKLNEHAMALLGISAKLGTVEVDENGVDMVPNYSGKFMEPEVLPALWPSFVVNGIEGIGTGTSTQSASHNMKEALNLAIRMVDTENPRWDTIIGTLLGPDMPCEADIFDSGNENNNIRTYMEHGYGSFVMRAQFHVEEYSLGGKKKGHQIIITGFPYKVSPVKVMAGIQSLINSEDLPQDITAADLSNADGMRLSIDIVENDVDETIQRLLYFGGKTRLQESFSVFSRAVVNGKVRTIGTIEALKIWVEHRRAVVRRRSRFRLNKAESRMEIVVGLLKAIDIADFLVDLIRKSGGRQDAVDQIVALDPKAMKFADGKGFTENQAQAIMDMTMTQITRLSKGRYEKERDDLQVMIDECNDLLHNPASLDARLKLEMRQVRDHYGSDRRCNLRYGEDWRIARPERPAVERIPVNGYLVRTGDNWVRWATRSNVNNIVGTSHVVEKSRVTDLNMLECVSSWGYHYRMPIENLPDKMIKAEALFGLDPGEKVVLSRSAAIFDGEVSIIMVTAQGLIKRIHEDIFTGHKPGKYFGLLNLDRENTGDSVKFAYFIPEGLDIGIATSAGRFLRMDQEQIMAKGKAAKGIPAIRLDEGEEIIWSGAVHADDRVVYWTESEKVGWFNVSEIDHKSRNTKGQGITRSKEPLAGLIVDDGDSLFWFNGSEAAASTLHLSGQTSNGSLSDRQLNKTAPGIRTSASIWMGNADAE